MLFQALYGGIKTPGAGNFSFDLIYLVKRKWRRDRWQEGAVLAVDGFYLGLGSGPVGNGVELIRDRVGFSRGQWERRREWVGGGVRVRGAWSLGLSAAWRHARSDTLELKYARFIKHNYGHFRNYSSAPLAELGFIYGLRLFKIVIQFGGVSKCSARLKWICTIFVSLESPCQTRLIHFYETETSRHGNPMGSAGLKAFQGNAPQRHL